MVYSGAPGYEEFSIPKEQVIGGVTIGIIVLGVWYPLVPGNVANATTFSFPVHYKILEGGFSDNVLSPEPVPALENCGVNNCSTVIIAGAKGLPQMQNILQDIGHFNNAKLEQELVDFSKQVVNENPDIGAILLECSNMPPYARAIQEAVRLPVFDFTTLISWGCNAVVRRPFAGFM